MSARSAAVWCHCCRERASAMGMRSRSVSPPGSTPRMPAHCQMSPQPDAANLRLTALPIEQAVALLRRSGSQRVSMESLRCDLAAGAPVNADGTINLIAYGAWLVQALASREHPHGG
jgi:hypothetical protein